MSSCEAVVRLCIAMFGVLRRNYRCSEMGAACYYCCREELMSNEVVQVRLLESGSG